MLALLFIESLDADRPLLPMIATRLSAGLFRWLAELVVDAPQSVDALSSSVEDMWKD